MPKNCCQKRLTVTRAVSGFSGETSQLRQAEPVRGASVGSGGRRGRHAGASTFSPGLS